MEFLKLWWMAFWRAAIVFVWQDPSPSSGLVGALGFAVGTAAALVVLARKSLRTFPLIRLIRKEPVVIDLREVPLPPPEENVPRLRWED